DKLVTGVQTCALPISVLRGKWRAAELRSDSCAARTTSQRGAALRPELRARPHRASARRRGCPDKPVRAGADRHLHWRELCGGREIGRASCRERGEVWG